MNLYDLLVYKKMNSSGGGDIDVESLSVTENGSYNAGEGKAYNPVIVNVQPDLITKSITANGTYQASSDNADGYSSVTVNVEGYKISDVSGLPSPIATFSDGSALPMPKLKVAVEPQQDLHGYDSPWVGGAGKNKFHFSAGRSAYTWGEDNFGFKEIKVNDDGVTFNGTASSSHTFSVTGSSMTLPAGTYRPSTQNDKVGLSVLVNGSSVATAYGTSGNSFTLESETTITTSITVLSGASFSNTFVGLQIELGSTATSFAPYSNECPISGWSAVDVVNMSDITNITYFKGLLDGTYGYVDLGSLNYIRTTSGLFQTALLDAKGASESSVLANIISAIYSTITSKDITGPQSENPSPDMVMAMNPGKMLFLNNTSYTDVTVFKQAMNGVHLIYELATPTTPTITPTEFSNLLAEFGINGSTITIQLGDTYYGGKLDVVSGVLSVVPYYASYNGETLVGEWISDRDKYEVGTTPTIGAQVVNIGATPTTIQLTPTAVSSLLGQNNLWADTGDVLEASYWEEL